MSNENNEIEQMMTDSLSNVDLQTTNFIIAIVKSYYNLESDYHTRKIRKREIVQARQIASYFIKRYTRFSLSRIGEALGKKDHATILHSVRVVQDLIETNKVIRAEIEDLDRLIKFKSNAIIENANLRDNYYHIDLNSFDSIKLIGKKKSIILVGFSEEEVEHWKKDLPAIESKKHINTGMYILEKKEDDERAEN